MKPAKFENQFMNFCILFFHVKCLLYYFFKAGEREKEKENCFKLEG